MSATPPPSSPCRASGERPSGLAGQQDQPRGPASSRQVELVPPAALPEGARRLFTAYEVATVDSIPSVAAAFLCARLCEDGDSADLRWLTAAVAEAGLAAWLEQHGARQLSRRSLAFWELALGRRARPAAAAAPRRFPALAPLPGTAVWPL
jgi:hypothetical protein